MDPIFFGWMVESGYLTVAVWTFVSVLFLALLVGIIGHELLGKLDRVTYAEAQIK